MKRPVIGVVIVNYLSAEDTINLITNSLFRQEGIGLKVVVVDNASPDSSYSKLSDFFKDDRRVTILKQEDNTGYARGNNRGIRFLLNEGIHWVVIMNSDISFSFPRLLSSMVEIYESSDSPAFLAPVMRINNKIRGELVAWPLPDPFSEIVSSSYILSFIFRRRLAKRQYLFSEVDDPVKVDCITGSFFLGSAESFRATGLFDEATFLYMEETIMCHKVLSQGLANYLIPALSYEHVNGGTTKRTLSYGARKRELLKSKLYYWSVYRGKERMFSIVLQLVFVLNRIEHFILLPFRR